MMRRRACAVLYVASLGTLAACGDAASRPPAAGPPAIVVEMVVVEPDTLREEAEFVGQLNADESVMLRPEIDGVIQEIAFTEGQEVEAGALLVRLRHDAQRAELAEAEAARRLGERTHERSGALADRGILSVADLDRVTAERDEARARVERARVSLDRTEIRAPFAGLLGPRLISPGDRVTRETALVQLDAVDRLKLSFTVTESVVRNVRIGMPVALSVAPWPGEEFPGEVYFIAPSLDPRSRRLLLKALVPNSSRRLRPGLFVNLRAEIARREHALVVPESALVRDTTGTYVWRVSTDGTAARAPVETGVRQRGRVEIVSGLRPGDQVVSAGTNKVVEGFHVRVAGVAEGAGSAGP